LILPHPVTIRKSMFYLSTMNSISMIGMMGPMRSEHDRTHEQYWHDGTHECALSLITGSVQELFSFWFWLVERFWDRRVTLRSLSLSLHSITELGFSL
jgi:hypothetical protein